MSSVAGSRSASGIPETLEVSTRRPRGPRTLEGISAAYSEAIERTSTKAAPWYVVPADHKWYRNWVVSRLLIETLTEIDPKYPEPTDLAGLTIT